MAHENAAMTRPPEIHSGSADPQHAPAVADMRAEGLGFMGQQRSAHEFARAERHSRRVRFMQRALPIGGGAAIVIVLGALLFTAFAPADIDLGTATIEDGRLVMNNPELNGTDDNQRPYNLTADKAVQDAARPTRIALQGINARLPMSDTEFAVIRAGNGVYDADEETLELGGDIAVDTDTGMAIRMRDADIDIATGRMRTDNTVSVDTGRAQISAESLTVEDNGETIVFENRVRMTILPYGAEEAQASAAPGGVAQE